MQATFVPKAKFAFDLSYIMSSKSIKELSVTMSVSISSDSDVSVSEVSTSSSLLSSVSTDWSLTASTCTCTCRYIYAVTAITSWPTKYRFFPTSTSTRRATCLTLTSIDQA